MIAQDKTEMISYNKNMLTKRFFFIFLASLLIPLFLFQNQQFITYFANQISIFAVDPVDELQREIDDLERLKKLSVDATAPLEKELDNLESRINNAQAGIVNARQQADEKAINIDERENELAVQYLIFSQRIAQQYKRARIYSPLLLVFQSHDAARLTKDLAYNSRIQAQDNRIIKTIADEIGQLEADKKKLEQDQIHLAALEKQLGEQAEFFSKEIAGAKAYQQELTGKIAELSAKQQAIINARSGTFTTSVGEVPLADDYNASIAFKSQAPSNSFAVFSFGAYTHRNGMSQYGAKARADKGQSVEEILKAYYPNAKIKKDYSVSSNITVDGVGSISFEGQYLQGIYEMPSSWHINALKAQAIAARTFAVKYTDNGKKSICATESCQVFKNSKKGGDWEKAVNETKGWVLVDDSGNPVSTQYASTHGGYANTSGWDTTDKSNSGDWSTRAWENVAKSPWFYKSWYRSGYTASGANCGRSHPWLSEEEFSDIINAYIVRSNPQGADTERIQPITINECNIGGQGGNPYSMSELRDLAKKSGGAVTKVNSVSVSHNNNGQTNNVRLETNRGTINISGSDFKTTFNLRAPGYLRIPQSNFAFYNIEHKK